MSENIIQLNQDLIHNELKDLVKTSVEETLNAMLDAEWIYRCAESACPVFWKSPVRI